MARIHDTDLKVDAVPFLIIIIGLDLFLLQVFLAIISQRRRKRGVPHEKYDVITFGSARRWALVKREVDGQLLTLSQCHGIHVETEILSMLQLMTAISIRIEKVALFILMKMFLHCNVSINIQWWSSRRYHNTRYKSHIDSHGNFGVTNFYSSIWSICPKN